MTTQVKTPIIGKVNNAAACGLLPMFILDGNGTMEENLVANYEYFFGWTKPNNGEYVCPNTNTWNYPGDIPLRPMGEFKQGNRTLFIYRYGIVAVCEDGQLVHWTRCD